MKNKLILIGSLALLALSGSAQNEQKAPADTVVTGAFIPKEIEDIECLGINKQPYHATLMPYANLNEALVANRHKSTFCKSLNGNWKFNWVAWPQQRPVDFYKPDYDVSAWKEINVPSNWQVLGYGTPHYRNIGYIFQVDFPKVMSKPPREYSAYKERNPVGSYRRDFEVPANWTSNRRIFLTFAGVDAGFFLWINGKKVGYSVNSRNAAEFDVTDYVKPGKNMVAAEVYRYTSGSYMEDQDMWRLSGIFRNVTIWSAPEQHIRDFFVKTDLDANYRNASVEVVAKVKNYGKKSVGAKKLQALLYDGNKLITSSPEVAVPALKAGMEAPVKTTFQVENPAKWTAETPNLYTTVIVLKDKNNNTEIISSRTGFRKIEIKGRVFMVNGVPVKLKGVNRHEHWPEVGHAITEAQMIRDLEVIKQGNCNHVRTCHYSDDPRWYELCDEYGIYLVAEANVECHGLDRKYVEDPRMKAAIVDRNVANVENFKNHPSVLIWSLGNENGERNVNFFAAHAAIKAIDNTRATHYEPFGIGPDNPADLDSRMYTGPEEVARIAVDAKFTKPFYLCEYAHAMFNSMGSIEEYNNLFDIQPTLLGGAIWEYQDQGLWNRRDPKHPIIAYGGGFGEYPNDHYFIHKGVVASDRSPKPHYPEMKYVYQWIGITAQDLEKGEIRIRNRYQFINLDGFTGSWTVSEDGKEIASGSFTLPTIAPFKDKAIVLPYKLENVKPGSEYYLRVSFKLAEDKLWAKKGQEMAWQQFKLPIGIPEVKVDAAKSNPLTLAQNAQQITVSGTGFGLTFDKTSGTFTKIEKAGVNLLANAGGPMLHLWRAPHQIDDMWAYERWDEFGLINLKWTASDIKVEQKGKSIVTISATLTGEGKKDFKVTHKVVYTISGDGTVKVNNNVNSTKPELVVARMGVRLLLNKQFDQFSYFGRGPMENYSDRKHAFDIGLYSSSVAEQQTPYEKPMECGNHEDVKWAAVKNINGNGILVKSIESPLQVSALPYSDEELQKPEYKIDLPVSNKTVLCVSHLTLGAGSNGCGPRPLEAYRVYANQNTFSYEMQLISAAEGQK